MTFLDNLGSPAHLRALDAGECEVLAEEIRDRLITTVAGTGGHLGPNLGVVELTMGIHRVFDSPRDTIIFDVGHQTYVHKMLTGRHDRLETLRQRGGLSGYPSRAESDHDVVENSHASASLSWADGIAKARQLTGEDDRHVVAVIGDGALTGGMAWEALNTIAADTSSPQRRLVIIVNDNGLSYAPTVGGFASHLDELGIKYLGPVDGHDLPSVEKALHLAKKFDGGPIIVHMITQKGHGFDPAVNGDADRFHSVGVIDPVTGKPTPSKSMSWTSVFGTEVRELADERDDIVAVTAAMLMPVGLAKFAEDFPARVFDVGIAEAHAVASAAGLSYGGLHPIVCIYSTFLSRAFDQMLMDVALHRQAVTFVLDRAGITGPDGASHHGIWDIAMLRIVPGIRLAAPRDAARLIEELREAVAVTDGPTVLRFPRGSVGADIPALRRLSDGVDVLREVPAGSAADVLIVSVGPFAQLAGDVADELEQRGISATIVDPRWVLPVPESVIDLAADHGLVAVIEDGVKIGGIGSQIRSDLGEADSRTGVLELGVPDEFLPQGTREEILDHVGLDTDAIVADIVRALPTEVADRAANGTRRAV
ncbi:1-deoxy-D-xylulose-5-phosphate synthase [Brevibacterium atlanticum]|uniref:1-deoxy-D-xylulose-5-phosphate synthase n=1 Tax=Brevibacterium atlanticum TaxID=2697563 RepID=UPI0014225179|nr:1-deoxy-D-xylulose-5-phosphate synthase [Brevibacterium atlanticum]